MKKLFLVLILGLFISGCGAAASKSEFWEHDTMYRTWDHTFYSWSRYKNPTSQTLKESQNQTWWGIPISGP